MPLPVTHDDPSPEVTTGDAVRSSARGSAAAGRAAVAARPAPASGAAPPALTRLPVPARASPQGTATNAAQLPQRNAPSPAPARAPSRAPATAGSAVAAAPAATPVAPRGSTWSRIGYVALVVTLFLGWRLPTERYITPTRGVGYALGIIGGSLMLLLLVYSARKHFSWLRFLGPTPAWFKFHMVLGVVGPVCILFHANFRTGAANSNVALFSMLTVAGSGFIGRYLYVHIHHGLYGSKLELEELQAGAAGLRELSGSVSFLPDLVARLEQAERGLLASGPHAPLLGALKLLVVKLSTIRARWRLHRYVREGLRAAARESQALASESRRLRRAAYAYVDRRLGATQRVAEFQGYERLFALWHALHIPLLFMLVIAAIVHVIAVNVY